MRYQHIVNVMRPTQALDDRGQLQGQDETVIKEWPCEVRSVSGNKAQQERMTVPTATHTVEGHGGGPDKRILDKDYLTGGHLGKRVLIIEHIADRTLSQLRTLTLTCTETKLG